MKQMDMLAQEAKQDETHWVSISDIMTGLMILFLFISISYMVMVQQEQQKIKELSVLSTELHNNLYEALNHEFQYDLKRWDAVIDKYSLSIKFQTPDILFMAGSDVLESKFKEILSDFYPRYINILNKPEFKKDIEEIRIEGHTSSEWTHKTNGNDAYFNNMKLSQNRTLSVLNFVNNLEKVSFHNAWLKSKTIAIGKSSSQLIFDEFGKEDKHKSRRVEFMVKTNSELKTINMIQGVLK